MAAKKKTEDTPTTIIADAPVGDPVVQVDAEKVAIKSAAPQLCGHVDMHSIGPDGKPDHPTCTLQAGHAGDHRGVHQARAEKNRIYDQIYGKLINIEYEIVEAETFWNDAAGKSVKDIPLGKMPSRNKKSDIMQAVEQLIQG